MKKTTRKLLPALAMLLVSAVMLATASFAWFANQTEAGATEMNVTLKSDSKYLFIAAYDGKGTTPDADAIQAGLKTTANGIALDPETDGAWSQDSNSIKEILPVAHNDGVTSETVNVASTWFTKVASDPNSSASNQSGTPVGENNLKNHVVKYTYYIALADGSPDAKSLSLKDNKITVDYDSTKGGATNCDPVSVIVVCGTQVIEFKKTTNSTWNATSTELLTNDATVNATTATKIDVYVYYDGENAALKSTNFSTLANAKVSFTLSVS